MNKLLLLLTALLGLSQCKKKTVAPLDQLPPATQSGANTFGCLVNGKVYIPRGNNGMDNNVIIYETAPNGANLSIRTYRYPEDTKGQNKQSISLSAGPVTKARTFSLSLPATEGTTYYADRGQASPCDEFFGSAIYRKGTLTLTRVDEQVGIVSGTFEFTLAQPGCDTIRVTNGRFDYKL